MTYLILENLSETEMFHTSQRKGQMKTFPDSSPPPSPNQRCLESIDTALMPVISLDTCASSLRCYVYCRWQARILCMHAAMETVLFLPWRQPMGIVLGHGWRRFASCLTNGSKCVVCFKTSALVISRPLYWGLLVLWCLLVGEWMRDPQ